MESINERIKYIASQLYNSNINELCRAIGVKQATMSNIVAGRMSKPSFEVINAIVENTSVDAYWLITGKGSFTHQEVSTSTDETFGKNDDSHYIECIRNLSEASKKNAEANILNAEANNRNSQNLEKLIQIISTKQ